MVWWGLFRQALRWVYKCFQKAVFIFMPKVMIKYSTHPTTR